MNGQMNFVAEVKLRLSKAFEDWLNTNLNRIKFKNEKIKRQWGKNLEKELKTFGSKRATIPTVAGFALWAFNIICNLGVTAVIGIDGYKVYESTWERSFDRKTTENLLFWICEAVKLMQIPKEVAEVIGWT